MMARVCQIHLRAGHELGSFSAPDLRAAEGQIETEGEHNEHGGHMASHMGEHESRVPVPQSTVIRCRDQPAARRILRFLGFS